jgi:diaminopimelate epimerase
MHGIGNDFVLIDTKRDGLPIGDLSSLAKRVCDRNFGVGADGLILVEQGDSGLSMRMFNPDGSESEMCGNGLRTFAKLCYDRGYAKTPFSVSTGRGDLGVDCHENGLVSINMGQAILDPGKIGMLGVSGDAFINQDIKNGRLGTAVSMGNPHLVIFVEDVDELDLDVEGPKYERSSIFPNRTNVHFVKVNSRNEITQRTWERGAGATLACGTGACASVVAAVINNRTDRNVKVNLPGGQLLVDYLEDNSVQMTGPAAYSFEGTSSTLL